PGGAGRGPASLWGGINAVAGQRPALPFGSFPGEAWQGVHRLFQPQQMQLVFRAVAEALG
uniref:hypothetical protein n=1 Tax=Stenotrophomonas maltophilia TaxID=40324 RepID=UPI002E79684A